MSQPETPVNCSLCGKPRGDSWCSLCQACISACTNCGKAKEQEWNWFCNRCTAAKEKAYQECREAGIATFGEVALARDKALMEARAADQTPDQAPDQPAVQLP